MNISTGRRNRRRPGVDGDQAWLVAVSAFSANMLFNGTVKSLGILLTEIREEFSTDTWIIGVSVTLGYALGGILSKSNFFIIGLHVYA